jgi:hypothetical protein
VIKTEGQEALHIVQPNDATASADSSAAITVMR